MESLLPRQRDMLELAREQGKVLVDELAQRFDVTPQTVRKDLNELCDRRLMVRIHGGATVASGVQNLSYDARRFVAVDEKRAIGRAVASMVSDDSSLFINIGTTTEAVANALIGHRNLLVITNNLNVAMSLCKSPNHSVIVAGGPVRGADSAVIGSAAVDLIRQFKVDTAIIGTSALDEDGALLDFDYREVQVAQAIIENARRVILVADRTKLERSAPVRIAHLGQVQVFVTDSLPSRALRQICTDKGIQLVETDEMEKGL
jgi:DeoR family glycerol-3-phosphate regulon repressor